MAAIVIATEGNDDFAVASRMVEAAGHIVAPASPGEHGGHGALDGALAGYARAAAHAPWMVLRDLDRAACAPELVNLLAAWRPPMLNRG
jgi:hypothetical protein